jgi:hypothetical protein
MLNTTQYYQQHYSLLRLQQKWGQRSRVFYISLHKDIILIIIIIIIYAAHISIAVVMEQYIYRRKKLI